MAKKVTSGKKGPTFKDEKEESRADEKKEDPKEDLRDDREAGILVRRAQPADVVKETPVAPSIGPKEKLFECPAGHLLSGPSDSDTLWDSKCRLNANPKR